MAIVYFQGYREHYRILRIVPRDDDWFWRPSECCWFIPGTLNPTE